MSMLTGKCDFYDSVNMIGNIKEYLGDNAEIYVGDIRIPNETEKDIVPYYPFLTSVSYYSNGHSIIHLCRYSYIDYEEYDRLTNMLSNVLKYYNKCKKNKAEFSFEGFKNSKYHYFHTNDDTYEELCNRIQKNGKKANILNMSLSYYDKYARPRFYDLLITHGYDEQFAYNWVYKRKEKLWYERHYED